MNGLGRADLPLGRPGLTLLVDARADDGGTELLGQREEGVEPGADGIALLQVDRVDDSTTADPCQRRLDHWCLGRVDHERCGRLGGEARRDLLHVGNAVGPGVVDAHVDEVRALLDLFLGHGHTGVPLAFEHGLAELLRAVGSGALADYQERAVLGERNVGVDGGGALLAHGGADGRGQARTDVDHCGQVGRRRSAAPADDRHAQLADELTVVLGELVRLEVVVHGAVHDRRQAGVGQARHRNGGVAGEVPERLEHLGGPGGAVESDDIDVHGLQGHQGGTDFGARQHGPRHLDGDLALDRQLDPGPLHGSPGTVDGGLGLQEVEDCFDDDEVGAALDECVALLFIGVTQVDVAGLAEGRELGARTDAAGDPARLVWRSELFGSVPGQLDGGQVQLTDPVALAVLGEHRSERTEGVGLDDIAADFVEGPVDLLDGVGPGSHQQLVAPFEVGAAEVVSGQFGHLEVGPHGAVEDDDALGDGLEIARFGAVGSHSPPTILAQEVFRPHPAHSFSIRRALPAPGAGSSRASRARAGVRADERRRSFSIGTVRTPC